MRARRVAAAGVVVAVIAGCGSPGTGGQEFGSGEGNDQGEAAEAAPHPGPLAPEEGPFHPDAELRPDLMEVHPGEASPAQLVELHFPQETSRGVGFSLEERVGTGWQVRYFLISSEQSPSGSANDLEPRHWWMPPDNPDRVEWSDLGMEGPGPDIALVPGPATPGDYRICTAMQSDSFCAELTITP